MDQEQDPDMEEIDSIWHDMWSTMVEGGKKMVKKLAEVFDRQSEGVKQSDVSEN